MTLRHCKRVHTVVLVVPKRGRFLRTPSSHAPPLSCHITGTLNHLPTYFLGPVHLWFTCPSVGRGGGVFSLELSDHSSIISLMFRS